MHRLSGRDHDFGPQRSGPLLRQPLVGLVRAWAIVFGCCNDVKVVCTRCLGVINAKWSKLVPAMQTCDVTHEPGIKATQRVVPL
jgi:hypothetical protein